MANSMAASTVSSSKAPTVEEYRFSPAIRPGSSNSSIPICDTMPRSAASGPYFGHRTSTRRSSDRACHRPWTASTQGPWLELVLQRVDLVHERVRRRGGLQFAVTVGEGDAGVLGSRYGVDRRQADEIEKLIDINWTVQVGRRPAPSIEKRLRKDGTPWSLPASDLGFTEPVAGTPRSMYPVTDGPARLRRSRAITSRCPWQWPAEAE